MDLFEATSPNLSLSGSSPHTPGRSQCNWCDFTSGSQTLMSTHERALHSAEMSASFFCTFCPAKLSSAVGLHLHTSRKHGVSHLPGWPAQSSRAKRGGDTIVRPISERNLGDGWVVGDTLEGARVQYKADFYVNAFHTVGDGYVRLELLGPHCSASPSNPTYLHELNRILEGTVREDQESFEDAEDLKIDEIEFKQKLIDTDILDIQDQRQSHKMVADDQQSHSGYSCAIKETFRDTARARGENRPPKEYFCASCSFRTKYSSSLRRHTSKMHKLDARKQY